MSIHLSINNLVQKLNQIINDSREQRVMKMATDGKSLADLLPEHRIIINKQPLSIESAIAVAVQPLINDGIVYSNYTAAILKQFERRNIWSLVHILHLFTLVLIMYRMV